ncbi:unnamed protein product [Rotaria sordida]|uniref:Uncharacterized protein n=1 Tax=Rotaria sordida TaxID=392033 RepID=A0A816D5M6_9BILA|nr:unnamed protein product [Rotaria sordida]CAF1632826.1 unnamed protein product [Rotaria sordida]
MQINNQSTIDEEKYDNLNRMNTSQNDVYMNNTDKIDWDNGIDFGNMVAIKKKEKPLQEQILSQKFTQLSIVRNTEQPVTIKNIIDEIDKIPNFLSKRNKSFKAIINQALSITTIIRTNEMIEQLRQMGILIYKTIFIRTHHSLWLTYFKSGTGRLIIQAKEQLNYSTNLPVWPKEINALAQKPTHINKENENEFYMNFVNKHLRILDNQLKEYECELNKRITSIPGNSLQVQHLIETYVEQNLSSLRMEIEHKIQLIHYDYHIQALKLEYYRHDPNVYQKNLMKMLCCSKYEQELTKQEFDLLQQQINYYNSPCQSFECSSLSQSELIYSIQDTNIRQELFNQYKKIAVQSRLDIFNLYMKSAKIQMDECNKKFDTDMKKLKHDRQSSCDNEKISPVMIDLIEQRCNKIGDRIRCTYIFKGKSICVKHN